MSGKEKRASPTGLVFGVVGLIVLAVVVGMSVSRQLEDAGEAGGRSGTESAAIGGPFTLVNQDGETVTESILLGKVSLVYFGYTYCPDVCPMALSAMSDALDMVGPEIAGQIRPVFISVDPGRDTVAVVKDYVAHFYPGMIGLTGTEEQVAAAARAYRVYYRKSEETAEDAENYLVDHSSIIYVMGTDGRYLEHFTHATPPKTMADRLMKRLGA